MRKASIFVFIFILANLVFADQQFKPRAFKQIIDTGTQMALNQDYGRLIPLFETAVRESSFVPFFAFYLMMAYEAMMIDYETVEWENIYDSLSLIVENGFKTMLKKDKHNAWAHYYLGSLYVTKAAHELRFSNYLNFTKSVLKGIRTLKKSVALDSTLYDAYVYLGVYQFAKAEFFDWLPFMEDDKSEAVEMIETAARKALFSREVAEQILVGLYGHMDRLDKAVEIAEDFKRRYPDNRAIYWLLGNVYLSKKKYREAGRTFETLKPMVEGIPARYLFNRVALNASLARIYYHLESYQQCIALCDQILASKTADKRILKFRKFARKYKEKSEKELAGAFK
jgi:tetratricopeptide (TPR) repeat protein